MLQIKLDPEQPLDTEGGVSVGVDPVTPPGAMAVVRHFSDGQKNNGP